MPYVPSDDRPKISEAAKHLADTIASVAAKHGYEAAFAGELNYALTRLLQELPRSLVKEGTLKEEIRYWIQPLMYGVLLDVTLEHKRRVNTAYEAAQIVKSGDCFDAPFYTKLVEVVNESGKVIGHQEVMVKRSDETLKDDVIGRIVIRQDAK